MPSIISRVVVLPAPLGPVNQTASLGEGKLTPRTAWIEPKDLRRLCTARSGGGRCLLPENTWFAGGWEGC